MQGKLEELEQEIMELNGNSERLLRSYNELVELQLVLEKAGAFFDRARADAQAEAMDASYAGAGGSGGLGGGLGGGAAEAIDAPLLEAAMPVSGGQVW